MALFALTFLPFLVINAGELRIISNYVVAQIDWRDVRRATGDGRDAFMSVDPTAAPANVEPTPIPDQRDLPVQLRMLEEVSLMDHPGSPEMGKEAIDITARDRFSVQGEKFTIIGVWGPPPYQNNQSYLQIRTQSGKEGWIFRRDLPFTDDELYKLITDGLADPDGDGPQVPAIHQHKPTQP